MANFLLTQTGEEVQDILNQAPKTADDLQQEVTNREQAVAAEQEARETAISKEVTARNEAIAAAIAAALTDYYTKGQTDTKLSAYSTTTEMQQAISTAISAALNGYSTTDEMNEAITVALGDYFTKEEVMAITGAITQTVTELSGRVNDIKEGEIPVKLADNLSSWAERGETPQNSEWTDQVRTVGGDMSIDSERPASLLSVVPQSASFYAEKLKATGFNLLHGSAQAGSAYYFEVPALVYGLINTAEENNGLLFTNQHGDNLKPTVYFKPLTAGVPQHANDGEVCEYTDAGGYRFYTCSEPGYIIVSNIAFEETCAHIAWSRRYNEFIAPDASTDAGAELPMASLIHAVHDYDLLLRAARGEEYVYDELRAVSGNVNWFRRVERIKPAWVNADNGDGTYTHTAIIADIKANGVAACGDLTIATVGTTISYTDNQAEATTDYVLYQLAEPVSGIVEQGNTFTVEDWGLEILVDAQGTALITTQYYQSLPDAIAALLTKVPQLRIDLTEESNRRVQGDLELQRNINAEKERAESAEQTLDGKIAAEKARAEGAESELQTAISNEKTRAEGAEQTLDGKIDSETAARQQAINSLDGRVGDIEAVIPAAATPGNQLADRDFVNSSIASNTGNLKGNFNLITDLELTIEATDAEIATALASKITSPGNNDYCFVGIPVSDQTPDEIAVTKRFKYNATLQAWMYEYSLNNSTFTAAQFNAINSGITAALVKKLGDLPTATALSTQISTAITTALLDYYTKIQIDTLIADYSTTQQMTDAITNALLNYYTKTDIDTLIADYSTTAQMTQAISTAISTALQSYSTTQQMNVAISAALSPYYTKAEISSILAGYVQTGTFNNHVNNTTIHVTAAERDAWNAKQAAITDGAQIGLGMGTSSEAATATARTATIASFLLLKNMPVTITFTNAINVMGATLNISSTGAKPLFIQGAALQAGVVKAGDVVTLIYDGTHFNIVQILNVATAPSDLFVDMGLPSGRLWAVANIDVTTKSGFAEVDGKPSPFIYEGTFFSWGNTEGHNPISTSAFSYDWGTGNDGPYAQTPGAQLTANAGLSFDAARAILGAPWRDPSTEDFAELFANIDYVQADGTTVIDASVTNKLVTVNGIVGIYLKSKINGKLLFFPCSGYGYGQSWHYRGSVGYYWSRSLDSQTNGRSLYFRSGGVFPQNNNHRFDGFARRAVQ